MRRRRKALLALVSAAVLVIGSIVGTMAYLTDEDAVTNTFTVGTVNLKLDEAKANADGSLVAAAGRVQANTYKLLPGHTYNKDPMVTVLKGSESSYIKMKVTVTKSAELDEIFADHQITDLTTVIRDYDSKNWIYRGNTEDTGANTRTYEFWYKEAVAAPDADVALDALFDQIVVPGAITKEELATIEGMTINATAYAMQADGFTNAEAAWNAFDAQNTTNP